MKNALLILNLILLAAVGFLFFKVFSGDKKAGAKPSGIVAGSNNNAQKFTVAYVDMDTLNEKINFIKDKRKSLEAEQKAIEQEWTSNMRGLQSQGENFLKKGNVTQEEYNKFEAQLQQQQQAIEAKKQNQAQKLSEKSYKMMEQIQKELHGFLKDYNKEKGFTYILTTGAGLDYMLYKDSTLDITPDVVKGLNEIMKNKN